MDSHSIGILLLGISLGMLVLVVPAQLRKYRRSVKAAQDAAQRNLNGRFREMATDVATALLDCQEVRVEQGELADRLLKVSERLAEATRQMASGALVEELAVQVKELDGKLALPQGLPEPGGDPIAVPVATTPPPAAVTRDAATMDLASQLEAEPQLVMRETTLGTHKLASGEQVQVIMGMRRFPRLHVDPPEEDGEEV
jgi:hypothetical protein